MRVNTIGMSRDWKIVEGNESDETAGVFKLKLPVLETDIDGLQHVNNGCYVNWCELAAWLHSKALGLDLSHYQALDRAMAVRRAHYDYRLPGLLGDTLLISTWLHDMSGTGMRRSFRIDCIERNTLILNATWELACIEISSGKPRRLPKDFVEIYGDVLLGDMQN